MASLRVVRQHEHQPYVPAYCPHSKTPHHIFHKLDGGQEYLVAKLSLNSTQLNSTSTQSKAEVSFILRQIQPPIQNSSERTPKSKFQFQLEQWLMLG